MKPEWITAVSTVALAVTATTALLYARWQLKESREAARVQHLVTFVDQFGAEPLVNTRKSLAEKKLRGIADPAELEIMLNFFETIALLVRRGYLDSHDVWSSFSFWMFNVFASARDLIEQQQKEDPTYLSDFASLMERLQTIERNEHGGCDRPSQDDIVDFWREEARLTVGSATGRRRPRRPRDQRRHLSDHGTQKAEKA